MKKNKYFTFIHTGLLELAEYHTQKILGNKERGFEFEEDNESLEILKKIPKLVYDNVRGWESFDLSQKKEEDDLLKRRKEAECPHCEKDRELTILGSTKNKDYGWKLDVVRCRHCKKKFTNYMPNNWNDMAEMMKMLFTTVHEEGKKKPEFAKHFEANLEVSIEAAYNQFLSFYEVHLKAEQAEKDMKDALNKAYSALENLYDSLLLSKLNAEKENASPDVN
jgi:hypothetical protein